MDGACNTKQWDFLEGTESIEMIHLQHKITGLPSRLSPRHVRQKLLSIHKFTIRRKTDEKNGLLQKKV